MTGKARGSVNGVELFLVHMQVMNVHEVTKMRTRLERAGNVAFYAEVPETDDWNRPTVRTAVFLVNVRREDLQRFRAMLKLLGPEMSSSVSYYSL